MHSLFFSCLFKARGESRAYMAGLWSQMTVTGRLPPLHDAAAIGVGPEIFVFGGQNARGIYSDTYLINTRKHLKSMTFSPDVHL